MRVPYARVVESKLSREQLLALLEERIRDPGVATEQDRVIWEVHGVSRAVLVIDLSGFTRLTRAHGILQFLTVYRRACMIALPTIRANAGRLIKCEADNVLATFARPAEALAAAREIMDRTSALDTSLDRDDQVVVCMAIGFGNFLELRDDIYGDEVNITFKLGEDIARGREILMTEGAHAQLTASGDGVACDERGVDVGGVRVRYFGVVRGASTS